jgi:molybdopterin-guanine dinucleotide biosynthesis protein A
MSDDSAIADCAHTTLAVLAGGEGRRMGGPKGNLALDGRPILERLLDRLNWPGPTLLVTAPGRQHPPGWRRFSTEATDPVAGEGPLRGLLTALEHAPTNEVVVLAVDMPNVTPAPLAWLAARLRDNPAAAAVMVQRPGRTSTRIEPLPAAFRAIVAEGIVRPRLRDRKLALHELAEKPQVLVVPAPSHWPADFWANLNTPSDLAAYQPLSPEPDEASPRY